MKSSTTLRSLSALVAILVLLVTVPRVAFAHTGIGATSGFFHGFSHPFSGLDHLCAMAAVGLWATQLGGKAVWAVPTTFVVVMAFGAVLGISGVELPLVEKGIVASVLLLGVLIAATAKLPLAVSVLTVALFAVCHGHAHGTEMPATVSGFSYGAGFVLATILLHGAGIGCGMAMKKLEKPAVTRLAGVAIAVCGLVLGFI